MFSLYIIYTAIFLFVWLSSFVDININEKKKSVIRNLCYAIGAVSLFFFSIRLISHSGDYFPYTILIDNINLKESPFTQHNRWNMESGYNALCWLVKQFSNETHQTLVAITLLPLSFYLYALKRYSAIPLLSLAIYIAHFHWWIGIVLIRQMYAMAIILIAIYIWLNGDNTWRKTILYYLLCIVAYNFHNSAVVFFILPLVLRLNVSFFWQCVAVAISFIIGQSSLFTDLASVVLLKLGRGETYMEYMDTSRGMNPLAYVEKLGVFFFLFAQRKYFSNEQYAQNIQKFYTLCLCICGIFFTLEISSRFSYYFDFFIYLFIIPSLLKVMPRQRKTICFVFIALYLLVYFIRFMMMFQYMADMSLYWKYYLYLENTEL